MTQVTEGELLMARTIERADAPERRLPRRRRPSMLAHWKPLVAITGLVLALGSSADALAAPGDLDATFDGDGAYAIDSGGTESADAVALQPDGKIVVVGRTHVSNDAVVYRLNPDGSFDTSFDGDGARAIDSGGAEYGDAVALQPDGKIVVTGRTTVNADAVVYRLNPDGSLDASFDGDGARAIDSGGTEFANAVALQPDGKVVVAGYTTVNDDAVVYRLNPDGSLDASFDGDGARGIDSGGTESADAVALQPDDKIVVAGYTTVNDDAVVYRLNPDGSLDASFDGDGARAIDSGGAEFGNAAALHPDGKIVVVGYTSVNDDVAVYRLNPNGSSTRASTATAPARSTAAARRAPMPRRCSQTARSSSPATRPSTATPLSTGSTPTVRSTRASTATARARSTAAVRST
jgi:uncharacterized delta-60 repeat protein